MAIHIYNSLTKKKEELVPLDGKTIKMYSCGVTVYDVCHIGHGRSLYVFDVIRRYLKYRGYDVLFARNITDVDDKIINRAKELGQDFDEVVDRNIAAYKKDLGSLEVDEADLEPRATENIADMITHIEDLIAKDFAYVADGDVYFRVRKFADYGKLSGQSIDKMREAVRIDKDSAKQDALDFALWKKARDGEPFWESPWGRGRPGWHIECSVMSMKYLKCQTLDIHAGGRDLIFPHHENEIAQSEALTEKPFARYWIHHGLLTINKQKMSKSLGNFITIQDVLMKYDVNQLKMFFLSSHYASPIDYNEDKLNDFKKALGRVASVIERLSKSEETGRMIESEEVKKKRKEFITFMDDDFNTPQGLSVLFDLVHWCNRLIDKEDSSSDVLREAGVLIQEILDVFGLKVSLELGDSDNGLDARLEKLLAKRIQARVDKDFKASDEIRDLLKQEGILVQDTKDGQQWSRL